MKYLTGKEMQRNKDKVKRTIWNLCLTIAKEESIENEISTTWFQVEI